MKDNSITKHNELIQASYRLTLNEMRIILYGISLVNPISNDFPLEYEIDKKKFIGLFGLKDNKRIYEELKESVMNKFWEREFTIDFNNGEKERLRWLTSVRYEDKRGFIKIYINPRLKSLLHQLKGHFTSYRIDKIASFKRAYSIRFYELSLMHLSKSGMKSCQFTLKIQDIKKQLDVIDKYNRFSNFKADVLEPAKKEINSYSDINFSYKIKKIKRSPYEIEFSAKRKTLKVKQTERQKNIPLSPLIIEKAKCIIKDHGSNWEVQEIEKQFFAYTENAGEPKNIEGAFIGFVKNKVKKWSA